MNHLVHELEIVKELLMGHVWEVNLEHHLAVVMVHQKVFVLEVNLVIVMVQ